MNIELLAKETLEGRRNYTKFLQDTLRQARKEHPPFHSTHEGLAVIWEEFEELKQEVFKKDIDKIALLMELTSVAAMCQRFAEDLLKLKEKDE